MLCMDVYIAHVELNKEEDLVSENGLNGQKGRLNLNFGFVCVCVC